MLWGRPLEKISLHGEKILKIQSWTLQCLLRVHIQLDAHITYTTIANPTVEHKFLFCKDFILEIKQVTWAQRPPFQMQ